jgi:hypothetical protein
MDSKTIVLINSSNVKQGSTELDNNTDYTATELYQLRKISFYTQIGTFMFNTIFKTYFLGNVVVLYSYTLYCLILSLLTSFLLILPTW